MDVECHLVLVLVAVVEAAVAVAEVADVAVVAAVRQHCDYGSEHFLRNAPGLQTFGWTKALVQFQKHLIDVSFP